MLFEEKKQNFLYRNFRILVLYIKFLFQVIEHYKSDGAPASLMATTSHSGGGKIDSRGESSYAQNSFGDGENGMEDDQSDIESIMKDHTDNWWNIFALCGRVFR